MAASRRRFLQTLATISSLGLSQAVPWRGLWSSAAVAQEPAGETSHALRFGPDLEPLVRLIEETPRDRCAAALLERLQQGLPYDRFLAAIFCAAIRKQNSGHDVYKMHAVHQVSRELDPAERLLPLFWAVDVFKVHQQDFPSPPLPRLRGALPAAEQAPQDFVAAMRRMDLDGAERSLAALARQGDARRIVELLWFYGCRDGGMGAHGAIVVSNCFRALESLGWHEAEPVLRFVIRDLFKLYPTGRTDASFATNVARADEHAGKLPTGWADGRAQESTTRELFEYLRNGQPGPACEVALQQLLAGIGAQAIWDAAHLAAAELLVRHESGWGLASRPLHANTSLNAMHVAFRGTDVEHTRLLALLQAVAWTGEKTRAELAAGTLRDLRLLELPRLEQPSDTDEAVRRIFAQLPERTYRWDAAEQKGYITYGRRSDADAACVEASSLLNARPEAATPFAAAARSWLCRKTNTDTHEYKFLAATLENAEMSSAAWRPQLWAASVHYLHGAQGPDYPALEPLRDAVRSLG